ncbi:MAG TPA: TRAM domain-containing protein [Candidatus Acidoferrales bacterium]|nr:TRAM domain-containing protein [Candidatus Acidoferrales bacterium]
MDMHAARSIRRTRTLSRVIGAVLGFVVGILYAAFILSDSRSVLTQNTTVAGAALLAAGAAGAASLALAAPLLSVDPYLWLERTLDEAPPSQVIGGLIGVLAALLISALVAVLLNPLPWGIGVIISITAATALVYVGVRTGSRRRDALAVVFGRAPAEQGMDDELAPIDGQPVIIDTSVLIDGRIVDVAAAGFVPGRLLIPGFVLEELQRVADSADPFRRQKGRRGLGVVEALQKGEDVVCEIVDLDFPGTPEVDSRLVKLARARGAALMTQDYNLNRLAQIEGVRVLNLNDLANAVKPIVAAGESMAISIVKEGKEPHQGVGYFEDGTMVVVENGSDHVDETVTVTVTTVLQTTAGRMIFASLNADEPAKPRVLRPARAKVAQR